MANCRLGQLEGFGQMTDTRFATRLRLDQAEDPEAARIGEDAQESGQARRSLVVEGNSREQRCAVEDGQGGWRTGRGSSHVAKHIDTSRCWLGTWLALIHVNMATYRGAADVVRHRAERR